jgi:hypothetical protein
MARETETERVSGHSTPFSVWVCHAPRLSVRCEMEELSGVLPGDSSGPVPSTQRYHSHSAVASKKLHNNSTCLSAPPFPQKGEK